MIGGGCYSLIDSSKFQRTCKSIPLWQEKTCDLRICLIGTHLSSSGLQLYHPMWYSDSPTSSYLCFLDLLVQMLTTFTITKSSIPFSSFVSLFSISFSVGLLEAAFYLTVLLYVVRAVPFLVFRFLQNSDDMCKVGFFCCGIFANDRVNRYSECFFALEFSYIGVGATATLHQEPFSIYSAGHLRKTIFLTVQALQTWKGPSAIGKSLTRDFFSSFRFLEGMPYRRVGSYLKCFSEFCQSFRLYCSWSFCNFSCFSGIILVGDLFHLRLKYRGPLYSVGGIHEGMGPGSQCITRSNGATDVEV